MGASQGFIGSFKLWFYRRFQRDFYRSCRFAPVKIFHCTQVSHHDLQIHFQGV